MSVLVFTLRILRRVRESRRRPTRAITLVAVGLLFCGMVHAVLIAQIEGWSLADALWFTATAGTTVGFGDLAPASDLGRIVTILLVYIPIIPAIAYLAGLLVEQVIERRERVRFGRVRLMFRDHILFINYPQEGGTSYFARAVEEFRRSKSPYADRQIAILTDGLDQGLPGALSDLGIRLVSGRPNRIENLDNSGAHAADTIVVLAPYSSEDADESRVFDICHQLLAPKSRAGAPRIIAEAWTPEMRNRLLALGVSAVLRPVRSYPELMVRAVIAPGSQVIAEALFDAGGEECRKLNREFRDVAWRDLAAEILNRDMGTPIAIEDHDGTVRADLRGSEIVSGRAIYLIVPRAAQDSFDLALKEISQPVPSPKLAVSGGHA